MKGKGKGKGAGYGDFAGLLLKRPALLLPLLGAAWRFRARDWYRRAPFLPLPDRDYVTWRMHTAYGDEQAPPEAEGVQRYLGWAAWMRRTSNR